MQTSGAIIDKARREQNVPIGELAELIHQSADSVREKLFGYCDFTEDELTILTKRLNIGMDCVTTDIADAKELSAIYESLSSSSRQLLLNYARMLNGH